MTCEHRADFPQFKVGALVRVRDTGEKDVVRLVWMLPDGGNEADRQYRLGGGSTYHGFELEEYRPKLVGVPYSRLLHTRIPEGSL
jgi:hypothetical protein